VALHVAVARASGRAVQLVRIAPRQGALELWEAVCGGGGAADADLPLLLLPEEYSLLDPQSAPEELAELLLVRARGALAIGLWWVQGSCCSCARGPCASSRTWRSGRSPGPAAAMPGAQAHAFQLMDPGHVGRAAAGQGP